MIYILTNKLSILWLNISTEIFCNCLNQFTSTNYRRKNVIERLKICSQELRHWGDRLTKKFKARSGRSGTRMNYFRDLSDSFSLQCYHEDTKNYSKVLT